MTTEDFVGLKIANLLKEKGFDGDCKAYYKVFPSERVAAIFHQRTKRLISDDNPNEILCPTLQMAMKWLREEKNIIINVWYNGVDWDAEYNNNEDDNFCLITIADYSPCNSYEEAAEAAIKYCLENLI